MNKWHTHTHKSTNNQTKDEIILEDVLKFECRFCCFCFCVWVLGIVISEENAYGLRKKFAKGSGWLRIMMAMLCDGGAHRPPSPSHPHPSGHPHPHPHPHLHPHPHNPIHELMTASISQFAIRPLYVHACSMAIGISWWHAPVRYNQTLPSRIHHHAIDKAEYDHLFSHLHSRPTSPMTPSAVIWPSPITIPISIPIPIPIAFRLDAAIKETEMCVLFFCTVDETPIFFSWIGFKAQKTKKPKKNKQTTGKHSILDEKVARFAIASLSLSFWRIDSFLFLSSFCAHRWVTEVTVWAARIDSFLYCSRFDHIVCVVVVKSWSRQHHVKKSSRFYVQSGTENARRCPWRSHWTRSHWWEGFTIIIECGLYDEICWSVCVCVYHRWWRIYSKRWKSICLLIVQSWFNLFVATNPRRSDGKPLSANLLKLLYAKHIDGYGDGGVGFVFVFSHSFCRWFWCWSSSLSIEMEKG